MPVTSLTMTVREIREETPRIRSVVLETAADAPLPGFEAGAHLRVSLPGGGDRAYSLVDLPQWRDGRHYVLGVLLEENSTGGSTHMHGLKVGDRLTVTAPQNHFPLGAGPVHLIAGGIGITPILSMAAALEAAGRDYVLDYYGRSEGHLAFLAELTALCGPRLRVHYDDAGAVPLAETVAAAAASGAEIHVCGPKGMIEAVRAAAGAAPVRFEIFTAEPAAQEGDAPFEVQAGRDGPVITVNPGQSIIEALEDAGIDVVYDCQRGDCGICQVDVLEGIPDHRDVVLSEAERESNSVMQICVSRAKSARLVLDL
ncbi:PDR/VanB family oxidoreductase [Oceanicella sp. SM1341]|uniref:PDR/VanB family oxidoreductase n=1 Tax=Oceanicella sp. SM1341 TaxID=1548889 RepID=UPI000E4F3C1C